MVALHLLLIPRVTLLTHHGTFLLVQVRGFPKRLISVQGCVGIGCGRFPKIDGNLIGILMGIYIYIYIYIYILILPYF